MCIYESAAAKPLKYLVVDDHPNFRRVVRDFLPGKDAIVLECGDGAEAIARFAEELPDVVLMDVEMGVVDGISATRAIRSRFPRAQIVIVTFHDDDDLQAEALSAGAVGFATKAQLPALRHLLTGLIG